MSRPLIRKLCFTLLSALLFSTLEVDSRAQSDSLQIMSFNIRYGRAKDGENHWDKRKPLVFNVIKTHAPDLIGLQEALDFQIDEIRSALPDYDSVGIGRDGGDQGEFSAILYLSDRFELLDSGTFWLSDTPDVVSTSWGNQLNRICTWAHFRDKAQQRSFYHFNTHYDHRSENSRNKSSLLIARRISERRFPDDPFVLTGDFNAGENSVAIRHLVLADVSGLKPMVDTFRVNHPGATEVGTFGAWEGKTTGEKIDYIFVDPSTRVINSAILHDHDGNRYPSDHFPVVARLNFW